MSKLSEVRDEMEDTLEQTVARANLEADEAWRKIVGQMPFIKFDPEWEVAVIPPFSGAVARFRVRHAGKDISVYADWFERLGYFGEPYWEFHPGPDGDPDRVALADVEGLVAGLRASFNASPAPAEDGTPSEESTTSAEGKGQ